MEAVDGGAWRGCLANEAKLGGVKRRIAPIGQEKNDLGLETQRGEQAAAMFRLAVGRQIGDEVDELALVLGGRGNQLALREISDRLIVSDDLKGLLIRELMDMRRQLFGGGLDCAESLAAHAV